MSFNIVQDAKTFFNHELVNRCSKFFDENESHILKAIDVSVSAIFILLEEKHDMPDGPAQIASAMRKFSPDLPENPMAVSEHHLLENAKKNKEISRAVFNERIDSISANVASYSGISVENANAVLELCVPVVLGVIKANLSAGISAQVISSFISHQKDHFRSSLPKGVAFESLISIPGMAGGTTTAGAFNDSAAKKPKWIIPVIIVLIILILFLIFKQKKQNTNSEENQTTLVTEISGIKIG